MTESLAGGTAAAALSIRAAAVLTSAVVRAARQFLTDLERGRRIDAAVLRGAMEAAFDATDATGAWDWKIAYDACEVATVLFLRKFGSAICAKADWPAAMLPIVAKIASLLPSHTGRSEERQALQQLSTPITPGLAACTAAAITPADRLLEPSPGSGLLAIFAELAGGALVLNELAETRAALLDCLFPAITMTRLDAAQIDDQLDVSIVPSVVLMNPPFSVTANVDRRMADAALRNVTSALTRLCDDGRLVASIGASFAPDNPAWTDALIRLQAQAAPSRIDLVTGLLPPIWKRLPHQSTRVYRLQADTGERIVGREIYVAPRVMFRVCDWVLSHRGLTASTQHNASAVREVA
jgi:hypothetical protein